MLTQGAYPSNWQHQLLMHWAHNSVLAVPAGNNWAQVMLVAARTANVMGPF